MEYEVIEDPECPGLFHVYDKGSDVPLHGPASPAASWAWVKKKRLEDQQKQAPKPKPKPGGPGL